MTSPDNIGLGTDFSHRRIEARGVGLHIVEGGAGDMLLLLPGWPQTWIAWRKVMRELARHYRVIAVDPPGLGDSEAPTGGYDTASIASHLDAVFDAVGADDCQLVGHDVGAWISYAFAAQRPERVRRLVLIDAAIPGLTPAETYSLSPETMHKTWHFAFNYIPTLSETLVVGREREFLTWLFKNKSVDWTRAFDAAALDEYVKSYAAPGRWSTGLGYYRSIFESIGQNRVSAHNPLTMPVLAVGAEKGLGPLMEKQLSVAAADLRSTVIPDCGHYVPEEQPLALLEALRSFVIVAR